MITKQMLDELYLQKGLSVKQVADSIGCSANRIVYWMDKFGIERRSRSDAVYLRHNPDGDPFAVKEITTLKDAMLFGLGTGLYWGEGTKANKYSVRLGNSDPALLRNFISFLVELYGVNKEDMKFGLQIFNDMDPAKVLAYWCNELEVLPAQFYKLHITPSGSLGTYRKKSKFGVATVYYHNKKLRDILVENLQMLR